MKGKYLITTDGWFYAPDGLSYKGVWGEVIIMEDSFLGIKTNRNSTNWYLKVGSKSNFVIIAGCQVHYAVRCEIEPNTERSKSWSADATNGIKEYDHPTSIYLAK